MVFIWANKSPSIIEIYDIRDIFIQIHRTYAANSVDMRVSVSKRRRVKEPFFKMSHITHDGDAACAIRAHNLFFYFSEHTIYSVEKFL